MSDERTKTAAEGFFDRWAFGPVAAVRPWLFAKIFYLILAFDVWHTLVGPAWRYGAAGFNVAHFGVLDALPIPTREAYVGMLVVVGTLSLASVLLPAPPRWIGAMIFVLYTWGWSCSMLDSYQHHYLLSAMQLALCLFPRHTARDLFGVSKEVPPAAAASATGKKAKKKAESPRAAAALFPHGLVARVRSLGWTLVTTLSGIVYTFTAISKTEPEWRSGEALRNITQNGATMAAPMRFATETLGMSEDTVFHLLGTGMIAVQVACALGYLTASLRDGPSSAEERTFFDEAYRATAREWTRVVITIFAAAMIALAVGFGAGPWLGGLVFLVVLPLPLPRPLQQMLFRPIGGRLTWQAAIGTLALVLAVTFHIGAEYIGLQIGWFSYYMIGLALVALTPASWLALIAAVVTRPVRSGEPSLLDRTPILAPALGVLAVAAGVWAGTDIDLPGSYAAGLLLGVAGLAAGLGAMFRPAWRPSLGRGALSVAVALPLCWLTMTSGTERYDFYRFAGGDFRRRHEYASAVIAYRQANRYAPPDERDEHGQVVRSYRRDAQLREMEEAARREGTLP
ncbi:MAG: hypothetical protein U0234_26005 [Sandaracinus sp.]